MDWQDYEDGLMSAEEQKQVDDLVANEPKAAAELSGLRSFRKAIRAKGLEEHVPMRRLDAMLSDVAGRRAKPNTTWQRLMVPVAAGLVLISAALFIAPFYIQVKGKESTVAVSDFDQAWEASSQMMNRPMPPIHLPGMRASVYQVNGDNDTVRYQIMMDGKRYCLSMSTGFIDKPSECSKIVRDGSVYYEKEGVSWSCPVTGLSYQVLGGTKEGRWQLATKIHNEASN